MANKIKIGSLVQCIDADLSTENLNMKIGQVYEVESIFVIKGGGTPDAVLMFLKGCIGAWAPSRFLLYQGTVHTTQQDSEDSSDARGGYRHMIRTLAKKSKDDGGTATCEQIQETDEVISDLPKGTTLH